MHTRLFERERLISDSHSRAGVVRYEVTWHGFAAVEGDRVVDGVLAGGFYIGDGAAATAATDPLVTDEDRVRDLLEERGARVKQGEVAEALDWSKSKTSRVLSRMADADRIRKYQLGRKNVIELPDEA